MLQLVTLHSEIALLAAQEAGGLDEIIRSAEAATAKVRGVGVTVLWSNGIQRGIMSAET